MGGEAGAQAHCQPHPQGKIGDRVGFFPANFVQRVRPGESVWRCCQPFSGNKEQGYMSLKENQVGSGALLGLKHAVHEALRAGAELVACSLWAPSPAVRKLDVDGIYL